MFTAQVGYTVLTVPYLTRCTGIGQRLLSKDVSSENGVGAREIFSLVWLPYGANILYRDLTVYNSRHPKQEAGIRDGAMFGSGFGISKQNLLPNSLYTNIDRIRDPVLFYPSDPGWSHGRIRIRDKTSQICTRT
jgi:hypothetical protein